MGKKINNNATFNRQIAWKELNFPADRIDHI